MKYPKRSQYGTCITLVLASSGRVRLAGAHRVG